MARFDRVALARRRELIRLVSDCSRIPDDKKVFFFFIIIKNKILLLCAVFNLPTSAPASPLRRSVSRLLWPQVDDDTGGSAPQPLLSVIQLRKRCGGGEMWDTNTCAPNIKEKNNRETCLLIAIYPERVMLTVCFSFFFSAKTSAATSSPGAVFTLALGSLGGRSGYFG